MCDLHSVCILTFSKHSNGSANIIDRSEERKVDLIPLTMKPGYEFALTNRVRRTVPAKESFDAWFARPEDVIVGKLMTWKEGRSFKHELDIRDILVAIRSGEDMELTALFDFDSLERWTGRLGSKVIELGQKLKGTDAD